MNKSFALIAALSTIAMVPNATASEFETTSQISTRYYNAIQGQGNFADVPMAEAIHLIFDSALLPASPE